LLVLLRSELTPFFTMIVMWRVGVEVVRLGMTSDVRRWRCLGAVDTGYGNGMALPYLLIIPNLKYNIAIGLKQQH
jgi:hypothetical protein